MHIGKKNYLKQSKKLAVCYFNDHKKIFGFCKE